MVLYLEKHENRGLQANHSVLWLLIRGLADGLKGQVLAGFAHGFVFQPSQTTGH